MRTTCNRIYVENKSNRVQITEKETTVPGHQQRANHCPQRGNRLVQQVHLNWGPKMFQCSMPAILAEVTSNWKIGINGGKIEQLKNRNQWKCKIEQRKISACVKDRMDHIDKELWDEIMRKRIASNILACPDLDEIC